MSPLIKAITFQTVLFAALFAHLAAGADVVTSDPAKNQRSAYFTVGDNQDLAWTPLDSEASINAAFEVLAKKYKIERVWWRGGQDEIWGNEFLIREQSRRYARIWDWWKDNQYRVVGTNKIAVNAAHDQGMEIWLTYGLFDNGSQADAGFGGLPYAAEDKIRVEHPEWAPVNKYGTWRQGGPIEFCYPEARKAMVDYLAKYTLDGGYDGIAFLSYVENFSMRYEDEFGFNQPIVNEFKKRHGVDIRTAEEFDREAWAKLRGEYLTQFMRELHAALKGKKIAISVDGKNPNLPCLWNVSGGVRTVGNLWMDIQTWVKEGIVDEINLYYPNTDEALSSVMTLCEGTNVKVSIFGRTASEIQEGAGRIMTVGNEMESGFDWENYIDFPQENVPPQPIEAFTSDDVFARRRILTAIGKGKQTASVSQVLPLLEDKDIYVRRAALRALGTLKDASAIPAVERAMSDPENSVRWLAAMVLAQLEAPNAIQTIFDAVGKDTSNYQLNFVIVPLILKDLEKNGKLSQQDVQHIIGRTADGNNDKTRETAWYGLRLLNQSKEFNWTGAALRALAEEKNQYCRELALYTLRSAEPSPKVIEAVRQVLQKDNDVVTQVRASAALASLTRSAGAPKEMLDTTISDLVTLFRAFGTGSQRADQEWGWREVGNALRALGEPGEAALQQIMQEKQDAQLADLAWRVLYVRQEDGFNFITEEQDAEAHAKHPFLKFPAAESN